MSDNNPGTIIMDETTINKSSPDAIEKSDHRTVFLLGKIGVGKSTIGNQVFGITKFPVRASMDAMTRKLGEMLIQDHVVKLSDEGVNVNVTIKIFDTALQYSSAEYPLQDLLSACDGQCNVICFVFQNGISTQAEKAVLKAVTCHLPCEARKLFALIITNCEGLDKRARESVIEAFRQEHGDQIAGAISYDRMYTVGFPNIDKMLPTLKGVFMDGIAQDRQKLLGLIAQSISQIPVKPQQAGAVTVLHETEKLNPVIQVMTIFKECRLL